jgi:peroxiredoxin
VVSLLLLFGSIACDQQVPATSPSDPSKKGATASDFMAQDLDGKTLRLSTYLGKDTILLNFWQTWCEPCLQEFPHLQRIYETHKAKGFILLAVAMDGPETVANVAPFVRRNRLNFPILLDEDSHVAAIYNPKKSVPLSVLIDRDGRITAIREGFNPGDEEYLEKDIARALAQPAP